MIRSLASSRGSTIGANASRLGLIRIDPATGAFLPAPSWAVNLGNPLFYGIHERADGSLWIGQRDALLRIDPATGARRLWRVGDARAAALSGRSEERSVGKEWVR